MISKLDIEMLESVYNLLILAGHKKVTLERFRLFINKNARVIEMKRNRLNAKRQGGTKIKAS